MEKEENTILQIYELKYEELDNIIKEKIKNKKYKIEKLQTEEKTA